MKLAHSMIRVLNEARSVAFYRDAFGLEIADRLDFDNFTLIYMALPSSDFELELTINKGQEGPYELGNGYGHIALTVENLDALHQRLSDAGHAPHDIVEFSPGGSLLARFFFIADPDGYQIEVIARGGRFK
jgi:lactoylglutathione lyase